MSFHAVYSLRGSADRSVVVRSLEGGDRDGWERLWLGYLDFYGEVLDDEVTDVVFARLVDPGYEAQLGLVALLDGAQVGLAHLGVQPSTWSLAEDLYLEDLYVDPTVRRRHVGEMLITAATQLLRERGGRRLHWLTDADNVQAQGLYDQLADRSGQVRYTLDA